MHGTWLYHTCLLVATLTCIVLTSPELTQSRRREVRPVWTGRQHTRARPGTSASAAGDGTRAGARLPPDAARPHPPPPPPQACTRLPPSHRHRYTTPPPGGGGGAEYPQPSSPLHKRVPRDADPGKPDNPRVAPYFPGERGQGLRLVVGEQTYIPAVNFSVALWVKAEGGQHLDATILGECCACSNI